MSKAQYKRILIKVSGEFLSGSAGFGIDDSVVDYVASEVKALFDLGIQICIVIGGGNIYRGRSANFFGSEKATADYMGMLATLINALSLQRSIENISIPCRVLSAIPIQSVCEPYIRRKAIRHIEKSRIVIFAAGTGNPFFTTDTAAALRSVEMNCDIILKATNVDGVYDKDPKKYKDAKKYSFVSYDNVISKNISIMDAAAIALAKDNKTPIIVFKFDEKGALFNIVNGAKIGTEIGC